MGNCDAQPSIVALVLNFKLTAIRLSFEVNLSADIGQLLMALNERWLICRSL